MRRLVAMSPSTARCIHRTRCVPTAGKSSIAALLLRLYDPASGQVTLDGTPLTALDQGWLRRRIGSVAQEPALLSGTVRDIICYADPDASQVRQVLASLAQQLFDAALRLSAWMRMDAFVTVLPPHGDHDRASSHARSKTNGILCPQPQLSIELCANENICILEL